MTNLDDIDYSKYDDLGKFETDLMVQVAEAHKLWRKRANMLKVLQDFDIQGFIDRFPQKRKRLLLNIELLDVKAARYMLRCSLAIEDMNVEDMRTLGRQWAIRGYYNLPKEELRYKLIKHREKLESKK